MNVSLVRVSNIPQAEFGVLLINGRPICVTLEDSWKQNQRNISCIPEGNYLARRYNSPKFGKTFIILNFDGSEPDGRSGILFHPGNSQYDTRGCILLGLEFSHVGSEPIIMHSRDAFSLFLQELRDINEFTLSIYKARSLFN